MEKTAVVNRDSGFEEVFNASIGFYGFIKLYFARVFAKTKMEVNCKKWHKMVLNSNRLFSHCFRKMKNQQLEILLSC